MACNDWKTPKRNDKWEASTNIPAENQRKQMQVLVCVKGDRCGGKQICDASIERLFLKVGLCEICFFKTALK